MEALQLGFIAAFLQLSGYFFYSSKVLKHDIIPNPTSWLMFAYGTTFLAIIEWDRDASFALLALPVACSFASIAVAIYALRGVRSWFPEHRADRFSFGFDVFLTLVYLSTWLLLISNLIAEGQKDVADIVILACWNIGVLTAFFPLLRQVYKHPESEHATPWIIWTSAYAALTIATYLEVGAFNELMLYPLINLVVHGFIAIHTARDHIKRGVSFI